MIYRLSDPTEKEQPPNFENYVSFLYYAHSKYLKVNKEMNEPTHLNQARWQHGISRDAGGLYSAKIWV